MEQADPHGLMIHAARFWSRVDVKTDAMCWEWRAGKDRHGYGVCRFNGKDNRRAHRVAYELCYGDPGDAHILHECDNPGCCNPYHMSAGDHQKNMEDMIKRARRSTEKLRPEHVVQIREKHASGKSPSELAEEYGVSKTCTRKAINRETWKWVD